MESLENDYVALNALLNIPKDGHIQFDKDKQAVREYFIEHVNKNTVFFHDLEEKIEYLFENKYYNPKVFDQYYWNNIKHLYKFAYSFKYRFKTYVGALKFYNSYALKTRDKTRYLERYEDRVVAYALETAKGDYEFAKKLVEEVITGRFQPATPTFLNAAKLNAGERVSCFLINTTDTMKSIARTISAALHLSSKGGGVGISLSNLREEGSEIKGIKNASSGIIPVMKILEDTFTYANQLGQRQGAGAVFVHAHHPDIMKVLDTKRENADEKIRIKTLSVGIVVPDITLELARNNEDMYLFSPLDIKKVYGKNLTDFSVTEHYYEMVDDDRIAKKKISARKFFSTIAEIQTQSGYPYLVFEDTVNRTHNNSGWISQSNICTEILQKQVSSEYYSNGDYKVVGKDISCNLGSLNITYAMEGGHIGKTVETAIRALTSVSDMSNIDIVPTVAAGNRASHAVGLGQMNLHGFLGKERIEYGSPESVDFVNMYFYTIAYHCVKTSMLIAQERGETFEGFKESKYYSGEYFDKYVNQVWEPKTQVVRDLFDKYEFVIPTQEDWKNLRESVRQYGMYNAYLQAVAPTGSISYINNATASIHPITARIEARKEGSLGRVYYPAPEMTSDNIQYFKTAYEIGPEKLIDVYAAATQHVDQGLALTMFFKSGVTTRDINKAQIYAWKKGIKTLYYIRIEKENIAGEYIECASCVI